MIIVKFQGGLGNQMYQYNFYCYLKNQYPTIPVLADLSYYKFEKHKKHNGYELPLVFEDIELTEATVRQCMKVKARYERRKSGILDIIKKRISVIVNYVECKKPIGSRNFIKGNEWADYQSECFDDKKDIYLAGYWTNAVDKIWASFVFNLELDMENQNILHKVTNTESVSIHVRRGDYVDTSFDRTTIQYYNDAIDYINLQVTNPYFFIFSDDKAYIEKEFAYLDNAMFVSNVGKSNNAIDMMLMSRCKHNIICNSTFSTWGAMLNENDDKIVIAPKFYQKNTSFKCRQEWVAL